MRVYSLAGKFHRPTLFQPFNAFVSRVLDTSMDYFCEDIIENEGQELSAFNVKANQGLIHLDTNIYLYPGPWKRDDVAVFIRDIFFNTHGPIENVVALGEKIGGRDTDIDFYDYCLYPREKSIYGEYAVASNVLCGRLYKKFIECDNSDSECDGSNEGHTGPCPQRILYRYPADCMRTCMRINNLIEKNSSPVIVSVWTIFTKEGRATPIASFNDSIKEQLWNVFLLSQQKPILIHSSHYNRAVSFIFTLQILNHFDAIFSRKSPDEIAEEIYNLFIRIENQIPGCCISEEQFQGAITNALHLRSFALHKGLLLDSNQDRLAL